MASQILSNVADKAKSMTGERSQKVADLATSTKDVHDSSHRITSDYGVKQTNTDDWLKVASEDNNGPSLLEDAFAREKVQLTRRITRGCQRLRTCRFTASIMSASQSE